MTLLARDERAHEPGARSSSGWWWETWHLDAATTGGIGLSVRLACVPAFGVAWWWTYLVLPDLPGPVVVRDHEVGLPRQGLEIRADSLWAELTCETPFEHWTYGLEAFGVRLDDAVDALHGEIGERMPVGLDIEWEVGPGASVPHERAPGWPVEGYTQVGTVRGEVLLGRSRIELDATGQRSHTWGSPRLDAAAQSAWVCTPGLSLSFATLADGSTDGYVAPDGAESHPILALRVETERGVDGIPNAARYVIDHELEVEVEVLGLTPIPLVGSDNPRSVLTRALCRFDAGEAEGGGEPRVGNGWASWLDPG